MKTDQKGIAAIIIVLAVIVVLAIGGAGAWYYSQTARPASAPTVAQQTAPNVENVNTNNNATVTQNPTPPTSIPSLEQSNDHPTNPPADQTETQPANQSKTTNITGWKTRQSDKCGYEIKYPANYVLPDPNYQLASSIDEMIFALPDISDCIAKWGNNSFPSDCYAKFSVVEISCYHAKDIFDGTLESFLKDSDFGTNDIATVKLGQDQGYEVTWNKEWKNDKKTIYLKNGDYIIQIDKYNAQSDAAVQMLSTFKTVGAAPKSSEPSTSKANQASWVTTTYSQAGFELKAPKNFLYYADQLGELGKGEWIDCDVTKFSQTCPCGKSSGTPNSNSRINSYGKEYCRCETGEGAAGTFYTTYEYITPVNGRCFAFAFTESNTDCGVYGYPGEYAYQKCVEGNRQGENLITEVEQTFKFTDQTQNQANAAAACGNGKCEAGEDVLSCPQDCPQVGQSVTELIPYDADVDYCTNGSGKIYPTIGSNNYANWFLWNNCAKQKSYIVPTGGDVSKPIILYVYGDNCAACKCQYPNFTVYDNDMGVWPGAARIDLSKVPVSSNAGSVVNQHYYLYDPKSNQIEIEAQGCFYLKVYSGNTDSLKQNFPLWEPLPLSTVNPVYGNGICEPGESNNGACLKDCINNDLSQEKFNCSLSGGTWDLATAKCNCPSNAIWSPGMGCSTKAY